MSFSEWIKEQIEALGARIVPEGRGPDIAVSGAIEESESPGRRTWRFTSNPSHLGPVRKSVEKFCAACGLDAPACDEIGLVVNEALANVIRHAYENKDGKPIEMTAEQTNPGVRITLRDWGNGKNPADQMPTEKDPLVPGGLGLICMRKLMDDLRFVPQPDGMQVLLTRKTTGSKAAAFDRH